MKWTIIGIAKSRQGSIAELAKECGINPLHLQQISSGRIKMLAKDLYLLSKTTGIPMEDIEFDYSDKV